MDKAEFTAKMTEVAGVLGMKVEEEDLGYYSPALHLIREGERSEKLFARTYSSGDGKMQVSGVYPRFDGQSCSPVRDMHPVGISLTKTAAQIAHDIERRVLPTYRENLKIAWERFDAWTANREHREKMMQRIAQAVGTRIHPVNIAGHEVRSSGTIFPPAPWSDYVYKIEPHGDDKVVMEIWAPEELAIKILGVVRAHAEAGKQSKEEG